MSTPEENTVIVTRRPVAGVGAVGHPGDDLSALSWVHDELRKSLEVAIKALRRHLKEAQAAEASELDAVDASMLRQARAQFHQGVGVLELVGMGSAANLLRAGEAALLRLSGRPKLATPAALEALERAAFALLDYLGRLLAGKAVSPLAMFPQYKALQELAGATRVHPADLWPLDWQWRDLPDDPSVVPRQVDAAVVSLAETELLTLMRGGSPVAAARLSSLFASLGAGANGEINAHHATLWKLAAAFFEAQATGLSRLDLYGKRVASRLLAQLHSADTLADASDRLAQDLLFFCAQIAPKPGGIVGPRLADVRRVYQLADIQVVDYETARLGRFDPSLVAQARKRVNAGKEVWSDIAGGELVRLPSLTEHFALVGDSLQRLYPDGGLLSRSLQAAAGQTAASSNAPEPALAMEVATALLYIDASLDDADFDDPELANRVARLALRIGQVRHGRDPGPVELWMEDLYRRVSDRQTMGSVVQELRASLSEVEKHIDQYFRNPAQREVLIPVPGQLSAMRGVLSVLGLDQASNAVLRMRDDVDALANTEVDPLRAIQAGTFDHLADNLGALSFLIDMVSVQPQLAKSLFRYDPDTGKLKALMDRQDRPTGFGDFETSPADVAELSAPARLLYPPDALQTVTMTLPPERTLRLSPPTLDDLPATVAGEFDAVTLAVPAPVAFDRLEGEVTSWQREPGTSMSPAQARTPTSVGATVSANTANAAKAPAKAAQPSARDDDAEIREIFLEEAGEVLDTARQALGSLKTQAADLGAMTTVRRAFHTLKGSSRMVGLREFGDAAWSCEQLYNAVLANQGGIEPEMRGLTDDALGYFAAWVEAIAAGDASAFASRDVSLAADAMRLERRRLAIALPGHAASSTLTAAAVAPTSTLIERVPDLPLASDLDLSPLPVLAPEGLPSAGSSVVTVVEPAGGGEVTLDLSHATAPANDAEPLNSRLVPLPEVEEISFDLADFDAFGVDPAAAAPPLPALGLAAIDDLSGDSELPELSSSALADLGNTGPAAPAALVEAKPPGESADAEQFKRIGPLRISIALFNIFLNEADELSRRLGNELAEWGLELHRPVADSTVALAHSLAGNSATVGYTDLSVLARALEHALERSQQHQQGRADEARLFNSCALEIRRLLHQFAAGFLPGSDPDLVRRLNAVAHAAPDLAVSDDWTDAASDSLDGREAGHTQPAALDELVMPEAALPQVLPQALRHVLPQVLPAAPLVQAAPVVAAVASRAVAAPVAVPVAAPVAAQAELGRLALKSFADLPSVVSGQRVQHIDRPDAADDIDAVDAIDAELFPIFEEEALELLTALHARLRDWSLQPEDASLGAGCMRTLHTLKGGARLAGAMRLGELAHRLETSVEHQGRVSALGGREFDGLVAQADNLQAVFEALRLRVAMPLAEPDGDVAASPSLQPALPPASPLSAAMDATVAVAPAPAWRSAQPLASGSVGSVGAPAMPASTALPALIDWQRFAHGPSTVKGTDLRRGTSLGGMVQTVRVQAPLLDRLVNQAGEVSITRARLEAEVGLIKGSMRDLAENIDRLRTQLREIELQAEMQIGTRQEAARAAALQFDPLEMDRFTRFQEITRAMAESVADVATLQRGLQRSLQVAEDELAQQTRLTRDMQDDLLRTRMVEFEGLSDRLYRVVRQAAKESAKQVRLDIVGGSIEIDRGVLERMTVAFEHLLRNSVVHGIEPPAQRQAEGKDPTGSITIALTQTGNEVAVEVRDDGAGLNLPRVRERAVAAGLIAADDQPSEEALTALIFHSGLSTAEQLTDLAGRGVGMDVVRTEVDAIGGRIETASAAGRGASFRLVLPLTTAVTQVVMLRCGQQTVAVPSTLVEIVRRVTLAELGQAYASGQYSFAERSLPFFWLDALLQGSPRGVAVGRSAMVVVVRSADQRVALHVDEVLGNQEVVVKNLGPQLSRLPGLVGMTLLPSGRPALIYNPVALATLYGELARQATQAALQPALEAASGSTQLPPAARAADIAVAQAPLIVVVDDSLTVRRVTQRLLLRDGYRVKLAKDGLEGLEVLSGELPAVLVTDIEMPRMDGFDLVRNLRADPRMAQLPVIMITSRIAQKHRDYAIELGVDHYLGKPYAEDELLALLAHHSHRSGKAGAELASAAAGGG